MRSGQVNHRDTEDTEKEHRVEMKVPDVAEEEPLTGEIIGAAIAAHRCFGPDSTSRSSAWSTGSNASASENSPLCPLCLPLGGSLSIAFARTNKARPESGMR